MASDRCDVLVVGAGPAGLMAALEAASGGARTVVLERLPAPGRKLLATGGGRCNLTADAAAGEVLSAFGRRGAFMRDALKGLAPAGIRAWFATQGVPTTVQEDGAVFPVSQRAADVLGALTDAARRAGVTVRTGVRVRDLLLRDGAVAGVVTDDAAGRLEAAAVILAAGGCAWPALGSDGSGFALATSAGHRIVAPVPALVPLFTDAEWVQALAGIVLPAAALRLETRTDRGEMRGALLFTHQGLSGPAALNLSGSVSEALTAAGGAPVMVRLAVRGDRDAAAWRSLFDGWRSAQGGKALHNLLAGEMPRALATALCRLAGAHDLAAARARRETLQQLAAACAGAPVAVTATAGWGQAMVTRGGVALDGIDPRTMGSRMARGLFLAGEIVDLDGPCGGYNLTWAFASGRLAGRAAGASSAV